MSQMESIVTAINTFFHDYIDEEGDPPGVTLHQFCRFLSHHGLISSDFDHNNALEVFSRAVDGQLEAGMDAQAFRAALQAMASEIYAQQLFGSSRQAAHEPTLKMVALQELLRDMAVRKEGMVSREVEGELKGLLFDARMIRAAYAYADVIGLLFQRYATAGRRSSYGGNMKHRTSSFSRFGARDPGAVGGRSVYRLCRMTGLVPDVIVAGELVDVARDLALLRTGHLFPAEHRYFDEELMTAQGEEAEWAAPETSNLSGEIMYDFPQLMELLVGAALWMPPRVHLEGIDERVQRVHEVFGRYFGPPGAAVEDSAVTATEGTAPDWATSLERTRLPRQMGRTRQLDREEEEVEEDDEDEEELVLEVEAVLDRLREELPQLPPPQGPQVPAPPAAAPLQPPPPTKEDLVEKARKALLLKGAKAPAARRKKPAKGKKGKAEPAWEPPGEAKQVTWYARPPPRLPPGAVPPEHQLHRRVEQMERFQSGLDRRRRQLEGFACPQTGWVLRMAIIDEPLRAPRGGSDEVSTLIETALTSRRLRHYDTAASMLIEARRLWTAQAAAQAHAAPAAAPSPSGSASSGASAASPRHGGRHRGARASAAEAWPDGPRAGAAGLSASAASHDSASSRRSSRAEAGATQPGLAQRRYRPSEDFLQALGHLDEGAQRLPPEAGLFFLCELASLHSALHEDGLALQLLWRARSFSDRLPVRHPDTAAVWCAMCRTAYYAGHHDVAARAAAHARVIREETVGEDTVETATAYNNLACCLSSLDRALEAAAYLELAAEILRALAGEDHPRTQTVLRNLEKARSAQKHLRMESPHLFSYPVKVPHYDLRPTKKKKRVKRKGSGSSRRSSVSRSTSRGSKASSKSRGRRSR